MSLFQRLIKLNKYKYFLIFFLGIVFIFSDYNNSLYKEQLWLENDSIELTNPELIQDIAANAVLSYEYIEPIKISQTGANQKLLDYGKTAFGSIEIISDQPASFKFELLEKSEILVNPNNRFSLGYFKGNENINNSKIVKLPKRNIPFQKSLPLGMTGVIPFRYVRISSDKENLNYQVKQIKIKYPYKENPSNFISSNKQLNAVWTLAANTIKNTSFSNFFVDGNRERRPYEADAYFTYLSQNALYNDNKIALNTIEYLTEEPTKILDWAFTYIFLIKEYYMQTGDKDFLINLYPELEKRLFLDFRQSNGLLNVYSDKNYKLSLGTEYLVPIIDWPYSERSEFAEKTQTFQTILKVKSEIYLRQIRAYLYKIYKLDNLLQHQLNKIDYLENSLKKVLPNNFVINAFLYQAIKDVSFLSKEIDEYEKHKLYDDLAEELKQNIKRYFYNDEDGLFYDDLLKRNTSIHSNVFAIYFGLSSHEDDRIMQYVLNASNKSSIYLAHYLLEGMFNKKYDKEAIEFITKNTDRSWMRMIEKNETITSEVWDIDIKPDMDWNHPWGATPVHHVVRNIVGISNSSPGYEEITIIPNLKDLNFYEALVNTPKGEIFVKFQRKEKNKKYSIVCSALEVDTVIKLLLEEKILLSINNLDFKEVNSSNIFLEC